MIGSRAEKRVNLNEKHEREAFIGRLAQHYEDRTLMKIVKGAVEEASGINVPNNFYMVRHKSGLSVPHGSVPRKDTDYDD